MASKKLKSYVRIDGSGRIVPGSVILRKQKPKVGRFKEIASTICCEPEEITP
jgi:hypothetical protein